jgi:hypothetical protein
VVYTGNNDAATNLDQLDHLSEYEPDNVIDDASNNASDDV